MKPDDKQFSVFATAAEACKKAQVRNDNFTVTFQGDAGQSGAVGILIAITAIFRSQDTLHIDDVEKLQRLLSEDGFGKLEIQSKVNSRGGKLIVMRDPSTQTTSITFPLKNGIGEFQAKQMFDKTITVIRDEIFIPAFSQDYGYRDLSVEQLPKDVAEKHPDVAGKYLLFPARDKANCQLMGILASNIAAAHGFDRHTHTMLEGAPHPYVMMREETRDALISAEKQKTGPQPRF